MTKRLVIDLTIDDDSVLQPQIFRDKALAIQGYWQNEDGRNAECYFTRNCLRDIVIFDTLSPRAAEFRRNMLDNDNQYENRRIDLFPWQNFAELAVLLQHHSEDITWQSLWMKPYNEVWPLSFRQANPLHEELFSLRRRRLLNKHVKAIWPIGDGQFYLVHLRSETDSGYGEHERLSSGFIVLSKDCYPEFFTPERAANQFGGEGYKYPWKDGEEALLLIQHHGVINETMTVAMLVAEMQRLEARRLSVERHEACRRKTKSILALHKGCEEPTVYVPDRLIPDPAIALRFSVSTITKTPVALAPSTTIIAPPCAKKLCLHKNALKFEKRQRSPPPIVLDEKEQGEEELHDIKRSRFLPFDE